MAGRKAGSTGLTPLELRIMQVLWSRGPSQVLAVQEALGSELAYTTVQTMLNVLHRKARVKRRLRGRAYEYRATVSQETTLGHALTDLMDRMFGGSPEELVMSLVKTRQLDARRLAKLADRVGRSQKSSADKGEEL